MTSGRGLLFMFVAVCMCGAAVADPELRTWWWFALVGVTYVVGGSS